MMWHTSSNLLRLLAIGVVGSEADNLCSHGVASDEGQSRNGCAISLLQLGAVALPRVNDQLRSLQPSAAEMADPTRAAALERWGKTGVEKGFSPRAHNRLKLSSESDGQLLVGKASDGFFGFAPIRRIQILSMGRVGSCFALSLFADAGLTTVFEPWLGVIEGSGLLTDADAGKRLTCLYECGCTHTAAGSAAAGSETIPQTVCDAEKAGETLAFKDTRIIGLDRVAADVPENVLSETSFVLLLRDPRAVWASLKPFDNWAVHSIGFTCSALWKMWDTAPLLAKKARVHVVYYEKLAMEPEETLAALANSTGFKKTPTEWNGKVKDSSLHKWKDDLSAEEQEEVLSNADCAAYFAAAGYDKKGKYNKLTTPAFDASLTK